MHSPSQNFPSQKCNLKTCGLRGVLHVQECSWEHYSKYSKLKTVQMAIKSRKGGKWQCIRMALNVNKLCAASWINFIHIMLNKKSHWRKQAVRFNTHTHTLYICTNTCTCYTHICYIYIMSYTHIYTQHTYNICITKIGKTKVLLRNAYAGSKSM